MGQIDKKFKPVQGNDRTILNVIAREIYNNKEKYWHKKWQRKADNNVSVICFCFLHN